MLPLMFLAFSLIVPAPATAQEQPTQKKQQGAQASATAALAAAHDAIEKQNCALAATILENFLFEFPGHVPALFNLAYAYGCDGRARAAIDMYRQTLEVAPKLVPARFNLGVLLLQDDKTVEALEEFTRVIELDPKHARAHLQAAVALEKLAEKEKALEHYRRAAELEPSDTFARQALLELLLGQEDFGGAQTVLAELRALEPDELKWVRLQADLRARQGKTAEALAAYEDYLQAHPDDAELHLTVGRLYREQGNLEQALEHFAACERVGGERYAWANAREQASTLSALKRYAEAIPLYQRAMKLMGDDLDLDVVAELGFALLQNKQYQQAVPPLLAVVRADPKRLEAYNHLASALYLSENYPGTIQTLDRRAQLAEETPATLFLRAISYDKLAQCRPAIDFYEKFLALNGDEPNDQYFQASGRLRLLRNTCRDRRH